MLLFLDIDGVLNDHAKMSNHYSGLKQSCVDAFNIILDEFPAIELVISSSWRYMAITGTMNHKGLENVFLTHGLKCFNRIKGYTESDEDTADWIGCPRADFSTEDGWYSWIKDHGISIRRRQIYKYAYYADALNFLVLDDINLSMPELYLTEGTTGITLNDVDKIRLRLKEL